MTPAAPITHSANLVLVVDDDVFSQEHLAEILAVLTRAASPASLIA